MKEHVATKEMPTKPSGHLDDPDERFRWEEMIAQAANAKRHVSAVLREAVVTCRLDDAHMDKFEASVRSHGLSGQWSDLSTSAQGFAIPGRGTVLNRRKETGELSISLSCDFVRRRLDGHTCAPNYRPGRKRRRSRWTKFRVQQRFGENRRYFRSTLPELTGTGEMYALLQAFFRHKELQRDALPISWALLSEIDEYLAKVSRIKIPKAKPESWFVEHFVACFNDALSFGREEFRCYGGYEDVSFIERGRPPAKIERGYHLHDNRLDLTIPHWAEDCLGNRTVFDFNEFDIGPEALVGIVERDQMLSDDADKINEFFLDDDNFVWDDL